MRRGEHDLSSKLATRKVTLDDFFRSAFRVYDGVPYAEFLVPGLVMMSILQNAFANSASSLVGVAVGG